MKKLTAMLLALVMALSLVACGQKADDNKTDDNGDTKTTLVVGTSADYAPFEFMYPDESGAMQYAGIDISAAQYVADEMGKELQIENMSFDYLLTSLAKGDYDIVMAAMEATPERLASADFSDPYYTDIPPMILVKADNAAQYAALADFDGKSVGAQAATTKETVVTDQLPGANLVSLSLVTDLVNELVYGKVDAVVLDGAVAQEYAETNSYMTAKHILFKTTDDSGTALSDADKAAKKQQAEQVAAQVKAVTDPDKRVELFDQLMEQYNEDTGESSYPHGYCFTSGTMVTEFEDACKALEPYEVSGVVESQHGYHVILRMPIQGDDLVMSSDGSRQTLQMLVAQDQLGSLLTGWVDEADISWEPKFRSIDYAAVFTPKQSFWKRLDVFDWFEK